MKNIIGLCFLYFAMVLMKISLPLISDENRTELDAELRKALREVI